jgi:hypothetical protein
MNRGKGYLNVLHKLMFHIALQWRNMNKCTSDRPEQRHVLSFLFIQDSTKIFGVEG